jgi:hypothetical protein
MKTTYYKFIITVQPDNGRKFRIGTVASSKEIASQIVMDVENCPESAIIRVQKAKRLHFN